MSASSTSSATRACAVCGTDLSGHRKDARFCSGSCSAEGSRLRRILEGQEVDGWRSLAERLDRARKPTERLLQAS